MPIKKRSNNPPAVSLELTQDEADFLLRNCKANIQYSLLAIQKLDALDARRESFEKIVETTDYFKALMEKLKKAGANDAD